MSEGELWEGILKTDKNYCFSKWQEFTTMTATEFDNFKQIMKSLGKTLPNERKRPNRIYETKKCFCPETRIIYNSETECANSLHVSLDAINKAIKRGTRVRGRYTIQVL